LSVSIDQFRSEGELETRGHFRLDESAAREKLRQFRLKDPHAWVLEFVRAAHIGEAGSISFTIRAGEMSCHIMGLEIAAEVAKDWAHAPFEDITSTESRVLRHVAIGLVTLQGLGPKSIAFEAGTGVDRIRFEIGDGKETQTIPILGTGIRVEGRGRFVHGVKRFFESIFGELAEIVHLKSSCQYPRLPVFLNGHRIGRPMQILGSDTIVPIQSPVETGVLGLRNQGFRQVGVYQYGVLLEEIVETVDGAWQGFDALVTSTRVKTDLGGQRIVRDRSFDELQSLVQSAWIRAVERRVEAGTYSGLNGFVRQTLQMVELAKVRKEALPLGLERLADKFDEYPVWPQLKGHGVKYVSVDDLRKTEGSRLHYTTEHFASVLRDEEVILLARGEPNAVWIEDVSLRTLEYRLDKKMYDMSGELGAREEFALNKERWQRSPVADPRLTGVMVSTKFHHTINDQIWDIELGFGANIGGTQSVWIKEGRLLSRHQYGGLDIAIMIQGDIPPNRTFTGADPQSKRVRSVVVRVVEETLDLAVGVLQGRTRTSNDLDQNSGQLSRLAMDVVKTALNGELADLLVSALGVWALKERDIGYSEMIAAGASTKMTPVERINALGPILDVPLYWRGTSLVSLRDLIEGPERILFEIVEQAGNSSLNISTVARRVEGVLYISKWEEPGLNRILEGRLNNSYTVSLDRPTSSLVADEGLDPETMDAIRHLKLAEISQKALAATPVSQVDVSATPFQIPEHLAVPIPPPTSLIRQNDPFLDGLTEWILSKCDVVFGEPNIRGLRYVSGTGQEVAKVVGDHVELDTSHPIVALAMKSSDDLILRGLLGSSVYTVINCHFLSVGDHHEHEFLSGVIDSV